MNSEITESGAKNDLTFQYEDSKMKIKDIEQGSDLSPSNDIELKLD